MLQLLFYTICAISTLLILLSSYNAIRLRHIPTEGGSSIPILSYIGAYRFIADANGVIQRGYAKHKGNAFKVAVFDRWVVILTGSELINEVQRLPDEVVSFAHGICDFLGFHYIFGAWLRDDPVQSQARIVQAHLTKNLSTFFDDVYEEIDIAFLELIPTHGTEWAAVIASDIVRKVIARASNRVFVGLPLARNQGYLDSSVQFTADAAVALKFLAFLPPLVKPLVGRFVSAVDRHINHTLDYLQPVVQERIALLDTCGDKRVDRPNDMLQWTIEELKIRNLGMEDLARMMLFMDFASIDATSASLTHALYALAARPQLAKLLQDEVDEAVAARGWSKDAIDHMHTLDSMLRESQRYTGLHLTSLVRTSLVSFKLSNGLFVPKGTLIATAARATHFDNEYYANASVFDPLRFAQENQDNEQDLSTRNAQFVTTSASYIPFGHGKHACPGRFLAAMEIKAMMAYILSRYDIRLESDRGCPDPLFIGLGVLPDPATKVMFRRRSGRGV